METIVTSIPEKYRPLALLILALSPFITRAAYALMNGRGLKGTLSAIWFGTNQSKPETTSETTSKTSTGSLPVIGALLVCTVLLTGCLTTDGVVKTEGVLITTVDTGMSIWASYVTTHQSDGKVTQAQVDKVKTAYNAYYTAQQIAKAAIEKSIAGTGTAADVATANAAVINAQTSLLAIINQYLIK